MMPIRAYAPNLPVRTERRAHILSQFDGRQEFRLTLVTPEPDSVPTASLWRTFLSVVRRERDNGSAYFVFCEDDHTFTPDYTPDALMAAIREAEALGADVLSGGVSWAGLTVQCRPGLFWLQAFNGMQFTVVFRRFYDVLLDSPDRLGFVTDLRVSALSDNVLVTHPYLSVQREFGYSDATPCYNNVPGKVERMFRLSASMFRMLDKVRRYYTALPGLDVAEADGTGMPAYVIHLPDRTDRKAHIERQFADRPEFSLRWVEACRGRNGADGLWKSIVGVVAQADAAGDDAVLICEDDHEFTPDYDRNRFFCHVYGAAAQGVHLLLGGVGGFGHFVPVAPGRFWTDWAWCTQFMVVYRTAYRRILDARFGEGDVADEFLSRLLPNKMVIYPFVSVQHDFGYSDVTAGNNRPGAMTHYFGRAGKRADLCWRVAEKYGVQGRHG